ncbi:MAG: MFS transporter [Chthoniobacterales bacterium]
MSMTAPTPLSNSVKTAYALGAFGPAMAGSTMIFFLMIFLTNVAGLPPALAGSILFIAKIWDAINDPLIGSFSDRTKTRMGRRLPWIAGATLPFAIFFILQWWVPPFQGANSPWYLFSYYIFIAIIFSTIYTALTLPHQSLTAELSKDYDERTRIAGFRQFAELGGSVGGLILALIVFKILAEKSQNAQFLGLGVSISLIVLITMPICVLGILKAAKSSDRSATFTASKTPYRDIVTALKIRPFRQVCGIFLYSWLALQFTATILPYYVTNWLHLPYEDFNKLALTVQGTGLLLIPAWSWLAVRLGKHAVYYLGMSFWLVAQAALFLLPATGSTGIYGLAFLAGFGVSVCYLIPFAMLPDVIELDELETGQRREGIFYGLLVFLQKTALALGTFLVGIVLQFAGYISSTAEKAVPEQPESALLAIRIAIGPLPAFALILGIWLTSRYPITKQRHAEIRKALAERTQQGRESASTF